MLIVSVATCTPPAVPTSDWVPPPVQVTATPPTVTGAVGAVSDQAVAAPPGPLALSVPAAVVASVVSTVPVVSFRPPARPSSDVAVALPGSTTMTSAVSSVIA